MVDFVDGFAPFCNNLSGNGVHGTMKMAQEKAACFKNEMCNFLILKVSCYTSRAPKSILNQYEALFMQWTFLVGGFHFYLKALQEDHDLFLEAAIGGYFNVQKHLISSAAAAPIFVALKVRKLKVTELKNKLKKRGQERSGTKKNSL